MAVLKGENICLLVLRIQLQSIWAGASKGTPGDAKCVTEIRVRGGGKNEEFRGQN